MLKKAVECKGDKVTGEWRRLQNEELCDLYLIENYSGYQIKKNDMGGPCRTCGGEERGIQGFGGETTEEDHLKDSGTDRRTILKWIFEKRGGDMDWIDLAQDRDR